MKPRTEFTLLIVLGLVFAAIYWLFFVHISQARTNPAFIPVLLSCTSYQSHCGREARQVWLDYGRLCLEPNYGVGTCDGWLGAEELALIFSR